MGPYTLLWNHTTGQSMWSEAVLAVLGGLMLRASSCNVNDANANAIKQKVLELVRHQ